jgi:hypothetical protein
MNAVTRMPSASVNRSCAPGDAEALKAREATIATVFATRDHFLARLSRDVTLIDTGPASLVGATWFQGRGVPPLKK